MKSQPTPRIRFGFINFGSIFAITLLLPWPLLVTAQVVPLPGLQSAEFYRSVLYTPCINRQPGLTTVHTQHRKSYGSPKYVNALIAEYSPYLKQHAHNPVHWFP